MHNKFLRRQLARVFAKYNVENLRLLMDKRL